MRVLSLAVASAATLLFFSACGTNSTEQVDSNRNVVPIETVAPEVIAETPEPEKQQCRICGYDFAKYKGKLNKEEVEGLLLALNDEYLAFATYDKVNRDFNHPRPFANIQKAEGRHIERLKVVFAAYDLPVPGNRWMGDAPAFKSLDEACKAGIVGEVANRDLYTKLFNSTEKEDIITVYKALQTASEENHLPAFQRCVSGGGMGRGRSGGQQR